MSEEHARPGRANGDAAPPSTSSGPGLDADALARAKKQKTQLLAIRGSQQKKLQKRILEMQGEIDELRVKLDHAVEVSREREQRIAHLRVVLLPYLQHRPECGYSMVGGNQAHCECGLLDVLVREGLT